MRLRSLQGCLSLDLWDLIEVASRVLNRSPASVIVEDLKPHEVERLIRVLFSYPRGYPIPYITNEVNFYGRTFYVDERVLVPRSETEGLIDIALSLRVRPRSIVDVGTGSGVLGITLKLLFPESTVILTDVSLEALHVARINALRHGADVLLVNTDLLSGLGGRFDLVVSNPPYVPDNEIGRYDRRVLYEPRTALSGGMTGFEITERLINQAMGLLEEGGYLIVESDPRHFDRFPEGTEFRGRFAIIRKRKARP